MSDDKRNVRFGPDELFPSRAIEHAATNPIRIGGPGTAPWQKVLADLKFILGECDKNGTGHLLPDVAIYFHELELRAIVDALERRAVSMPQGI